MTELPVAIDTGIQAGSVRLEGDLTVPPQAVGVVVFAHGSGSSRHSPRNRQVAAALQDAGLATLLFDLLTADEESVDVRTREHRFDIGLLAERLAGATDWVTHNERTAGMPVGYFGASTGAAAALVAAARLPEAVAAVVSRGGRPDLADIALEQVHCPVLLIVGSADPEVLTLNRQAAARLPSDVELEIVGGATHLFEEPGALEEVARVTGDFLRRNFMA